MFIFPSDINGNVSSFLPILSFETARTENYTTTMNVTQSTEIPISAQLPTRSDILRILILVFGLVDLSLICAYAAVSKSNRCMLNVHVEIENSRYFPGNNSTYENIDITFTNWNTFFLYKTVKTLREFSKWMFIIQ